MQTGGSVQRMLPRRYDKYVTWYPDKKPPVHVFRIASTLFLKESAKGEIRLAHDWEIDSELSCLQHKNEVILKMYFLVSLHYIHILCYLL